MVIIVDLISKVLYCLIFIGAISLFFYWPGKLLLHQFGLTLRPLEQLFLANVTGMMAFVLASYVVAWVRAPWLVLLPVIGANVWYWQTKRRFFFRIPPVQSRRLIAIVISAILFSAPMLFAGRWGSKIGLRRDDTWHLALISELRASFPPDNPGFAGVPLKGYHYFYNFLVAKLGQFTRLPMIELHFHFFPVYFAVLWGLGVYCLMLRWTKSELAAWVAVLLSQFGGSFAFILPLKGRRGLSLDSAFGIQQPATSLINPPFTISIVILLAALFSLFKYLENRQKGWLVPLGLCGGLITMFKVYAGMIFFGGMIFIILLELRKKRFVLMKAFLVIVGIFLGTYWVLADRSARLLFHPLWAPHKVLLDNLTWYGYEEKHYTYSRYGVIRGLIKIETYGLFVFIVGSLGTRAIGILAFPIAFFRKGRKHLLFTLTMLAMLAGSLLVPLFFIQTGKVFEIIQIAWYFLFFAALFAAWGFAFLLRSIRPKILKGLFLLVVLAATLPSASESFRTHVLSISKESLSSSFFKACAFLKNQGDWSDTVLEIPPDWVSPTPESLKSWYNGSSEPRLSALANKRSFVANQFIDFPGTDVSSRLSLIQKIVLAQQGKIGMAAVVKELKKHQIVYVYSPYELNVLEGETNVTKIYEDSQAWIYQVGNVDKDVKI